MSRPVGTGAEGSALGPGTPWVLRIDTVRAAVEQLTSQRIHEFFPAYLHLRQKAVEEGSLSNIQPDWRRGMAWYLEMPGGPTPYFRPFLSRRGRATGFWLNSNLAGSFAPSSLRPTSPPGKLFDIRGGMFNLKPDHAKLALKHLLFDKPVSLAAMAAFVYRDYGFVTVGPTPSPSDLTEFFVRDFRFDRNDGKREFEVIFDQAATLAEERWFEQFNSMERES